MDTIGSLIDKLTVVNLKIWNYEDVKRLSDDDHVIAEATRKTNTLNQQRNDLIEEIDTLIVDVVVGNKKMKNYKIGGTKLYGKGMAGKV